MMVLGSRLADAHPANNANERATDQRQTENNRVGIMMSELYHPPELQAFAVVNTEQL
jgi:hypothetical protein